MFNIVHGSASEYLKNNINITREPAHNYGDIIQDQAALHVIFPTLKTLALNLSFSQVANSGILYLIAYNVSLINLFLRK